MGRKTTSPVPQASQQVTQQPSAPADNMDIVPDGDFAGLRTEDVMRALTEQIHDVVGGVSIEAACATFDMALGELLMVAQHANGDAYAKMAGIKFCETALPYALLPVDAPVTYNDARKVRGRRI